MKNLDQFVKKQKTVRKRGTSILIDQKHAEFLQRNDLNLSALVRDFLDRLMSEVKK